MQHYDFYRYKGLTNEKTNEYKDFLENGIRLSKCSIYYYYNGRFYTDISGKEKINLIAKNTQLEYNVKLKFVEKGINLSFEILKKVDLLIID